MPITTLNWRDLIRPRGIQVEAETLTEFYGKFPDGSVLFIGTTGDNPFNSTTGSPGDAGGGADGLYGGDGNDSLIANTSNTESITSFALHVERVSLLSAGESVEKVRPWILA